MNPGFQNKTLDVRTRDGLDDVLLEPLVFVFKDGRIVRAPIGGTTDGLSVPRCLQNIIPATGGDWFSGVLHDSGYRRQLQTWDIDLQDFKPAYYDQKRCDDMILEAMESQGVNEAERDTIYGMLRMFGHKAFSDDAVKEFRK